MEYLYVDDDLHLEELKLSHSAMIYETIWENRTFLRRWLPFVDQTRTQEDTRRYVSSILSESEKKQNEVFTIWYKGEFAGLAGYKEMDYVNRKAEIGYWMAERMQGKGIMTRTVRKMIDYGFRNLNFNRIQIKVAVGNAKSAAIPQRLGLVMEGVERDGEYHSDRYFNLEIYSILRKEWIASLTRS
ncbi:MAG: GNAT family N-acetyltransferase [Prolixibacteraceae bacterium]|jgi:ribosomal-protein-serine acetyltransferase|nr:GNAT family N-acetyltransferase [Prolixibacteraceae bacterium]MDI9562922.1 GNAT family N-acetyltransferase [Bacteroidota bacterium]NLS99857.1 GNAT family N-acetyltransferase [Bacteroidales bacterium]HNZ67921.1 GNAT family N-acetyltransferase [Prolixibacteraceae bacterium]HOC85255.1 GNAT family N-acetyltransferase [Prolixibacteraceae bacterium]